MITQEGITESMILATEEKFRAWDEIAQENITAEGADEGVKRKIYTLLKDPTIYAYAWLRDVNGEPFKLYPYQDLIINDHHERIIFAAANQIGKSVTLCVKALHFALHHPGKTVLMVSKTLPQSKDLLRQIKTLLNNGVLEYKFDIGDTENKTEVTFRHFEDVSQYNEEKKEFEVGRRELTQSRIICVPATEAALGYPVDLALIDELAFYDDGEYFYKQILQPRTYHTKGQIIVFSNPNGQQGIFWELWNSNRFHKYRFTYLDCPSNTQQEFDVLSKELTQQQIDSTLLAVFTSPQGGFLSLEERKVMQEERPNLFVHNKEIPIYVFFDFAKTQDRTVRVIGHATEDERGVIVDEMREYPQGTPYNVIVDELEAFIKYLGTGSVAAVGWDNTGVGSGIEDFIKRIEDLGVQCCPVAFSLENKSRIYTLFKLLVERNIKGEQGLKIPYVPDCDRQLSQLRFTTSGRGYLQVHHEKETDRDDYPDALAGLCSLIVHPENVPVSITIVEAADERHCRECDALLELDGQCATCGANNGDDYLGIV